MPTRVGATVPGHSLAIAATFLDIRNATRSGIIRAALALYQGLSREEAAKAAFKGGNLTSDAPSNQIWAEVPDHLVPPGDVNRSQAVRIGLGMAAGLTREQAENWARMQMAPMGRPRKDRTS